MYKQTCFVIFVAVIGTFAALPQTEPQHSGTPSNLENDCGRLPESSNGSTMPWHALVFKKNPQFRQICGGTLVKPKVVISVAHCYVWSLNSKAAPASNFAVAVGKIQRDWNIDEIHDQRSDVSEIAIPADYSGDINTYYQADLAVLTLVDAVTYTAWVKPACLNTHIGSDGLMGKQGKSAAFSGTEIALTDAVTTLDLRYLPPLDCIQQSEPVFRPFVTVDKFCVDPPENNLCLGGSGNGIVFNKTDDGVERYYLAGVASTAPTYSSSFPCGKRSLLTFTALSAHQDFLEQWWR